VSDILHESGPGMDLEAKIRELAYVKWIEAGRPEGNGIEFWQQAEQELAQRDTPHPVMAGEAPGEDAFLPMDERRK